MEGTEGSGLIRAHELCEALNEMLLIIYSTHDLEVMLKEIVEKTSTAIDSESARVVLRQGEKWLMKYAHRMPEQLEGRTFSDEDLPHAALAMVTKKPVAIEDALNDSRANTELMRKYGIRSLLVLPMMEWKEKVIGVLIFNFTRRVSFSGEEIVFAEKVATGISIALRNSRLIQDLRSAEEHLLQVNRLNESLTRIDRTIYSTLESDVIFKKLLEQTAEEIGAESAMLLTKEEEGWMIRYVYKMPEDLVGKTFNEKQVRHVVESAETREPIAVADAYHDERVYRGFVRWLKIRSLLVFPLIVQDEVIGGVVFHNHSAPNAFPEQHREFVAKLQISLSLALKNARLFAELNETKAELESFDYTVAHDLRNALNLISLYCQSVQDVCTRGASGECRGYLDKAVEGTFRMNRLIDGILKLSQLSHAQLKSETVDVSELARGVAEELQRSDPSRRVKFIIPEGITAKGDPDLLTVAMENLLGNAWKYTSRREEAVIEIGMVKDTGLRAYYVQDNGVGFDMAESAKIFRPFHRVDQNLGFKGFGIGLATVERIIRRHGGEIWAVGEPDKGAVFYFTLP